MTRKATTTTTHPDFHMSKLSGKILEIAQWGPDRCYQSKLTIAGLVNPVFNDIA